MSSGYPEDTIEGSIGTRPHPVFASLWQAVWQYRVRTLAALLLLVAAKVAGVYVPLLLKAIVDRLSRPQDMVADITAAAAPRPDVHTVLVIPVFLLLSYALLRFSGTLFTELRDLVFARVSQLTVTGFAERAFAHLLALNPRFHSQRNTGALIRDIERGTGGIGYLLSAGVFTVVPTLVELAAVLVVMAAAYSLWFTLVIVLTFVVYGSYTTWQTQMREVRQRRVNEVDSRAHGRMVDGLLNYESVKTYAREDYERHRYAAVLRQWVEHSLINQRALSRLHIGQSAIIAAGVAAVMLLAGEQTVRGAMTVGDVVLVNAYVIQICLPLNALGFVFREARDALVNTERLLALLDQRPEIESPPGSPPLEVRGGEIVFDHVDFAYDAGRPILQDVSFTIGEGKTVAIVGGSGSGKSTLARLLLRMYDVGAGRVTIDGQDLRSVRTDSLRNAIGVVPQDTMLFNETIAYNIGYGRPGAGMADIIEAAKAAQVHEFILSLPQQYDTPVGERGLKLSGGEKQRIAIARAFLKNPPIMIFDEATSALDTRAERAIQSELDRIAVGRSTMVIAHRLSTIVGTDKIIVMDKGRIVERGRHDDLLEQDGLYAQLWSLQRQQQQFERLERRLARQSVNLAVLLAGVIDGLRAAIEAKAVSLYTDIELDSARVTADPGTLAQAVNDICVLALHGTPRGGRMEITLERSEGQARLSVTDGRHTLPAPAIAPVAPQPSDTADATPLDPLQMRSTIERQGGRFTIEPAAASRGMRFAVELPLRAVDTVSPRPALPADGMAERLPERLAALSGERPLEGLAVMIVDDLDDAREMVAALLQAEGAHTHALAGGSEALGWLDARPTSQWPHVLVCDIALGEEDGHDVVRRIRQIEARRGVPLEQRMPAVALSGLAGSADRMRSLMAGFQAHLTKPVDPSELIHALYTVSSKKPAGGVPAAHRPD